MNLNIFILKFKQGSHVYKSRLVTLVHIRYSITYRMPKLKFLKLILKLEFGAITFESILINSSFKIFNLNIS